MKKMIWLLLTIGIVWGQVDYTSQVQTIFTANCTSCHVYGHTSGLNLTSYAGVMAGGNTPGGVVVAGDHANSLLWQKVSDGTMPGGNNPDLSSDDVNLIAQWIDEGALETPDDVTELFFSEYAEGTSSNKYVEIYNGTGSDVDLSSYSVQGTNNGTAWGDGGERDVTLSGTLASGDVYVIAADEADATILAETDLALAYESPVHHNGDDGIALLSNGTIIDAIGVESNDPGSGWDVAGVSEATMNHTLVRKASVTEGNGGDWASSAGTDESNSEWVVLDQDTWDYLGSHPHSITILPSISSIAIQPSSPTEADDVTVSAAISDDGTIASATLTYNTGSTDTDVTMANTTGDTYTGTIPAQAAGTTVTFSITAVDNEDGTTTSAESSYLVNSTGGEITAIYDIQYTTDSSGDSPLNGQTVTISGIVTAEFWGSSSNRYLYVQDAEGPWNGVVCFEYDGWDAFDFTSSSGTVHSVAEGDSVTVTGTVDEYYNLTEILDVTEVIVHGPAVNLISPAVVTPGQIMTGGTDAEAYEGCLVKVDNVTVDNADLGNGEWSVTDGTNSVHVDDIWDYYYFPESGQALAGVSGVMTYTYSNTKLEPRLARDVVEAEGDPVRIQRVQQVLYSDLIKAGTDETSDASYMSEETVTIEGIITMPTGLSYAGDGVKFIFADVNGGPWSAILSYDPDSSAFPSLFEGDLIQATGYISEYSTGPANMTELFITEPINILDFEQPLPAVDIVNTGDLRWPTEAEQWGNVMVSVEDAVVTNNELQYEIFALDDGTGSVLVDDDSDSIQVHFEAVGPPPVGSLVQSIEGWLYHHYGSNADSTAYKLCPRYVDDMVFGSGPPSISGIGREPCAPTSADTEVSVSCVIMDNSDIASAEIHYSVDGGAYQTVTMSSTGDSTWTGIIPVASNNEVNYYITATDDGVDQAEPKTSMFPYDIEYDQLGFVVTDDLTIAHVQETPWPSGITRYHGCGVTLSGIVTADTAQYSSGYSSYAFQDGTGQWNGLVFDTPELVTLTRGDEVEVTGTIDDFDADWHFQFDGNTRLINSTVTVLSSGNDEPAPALVSAGDLAQDGEEVESYEGVVVKLEGVTVSALNSFDWSITDASGGITLIDDDMATMAADNFMSALAEGQELEYVMGIFNYSFGTYKVQIRDLADLGQTMGINDDINLNPYVYRLLDNFPNPFNPETHIHFELGGQEMVKLIIYDALGRQVRTIVNGQSYTPGFHAVNWDGRDNNGQSVPSGVYIYRIKAGSFIADNKMLLVK